MENRQNDGIPVILKVIGLLILTVAFPPAGITYIWIRLFLWTRKGSKLASILLLILSVAILIIGAAFEYYLRTGIFLWWKI